MIDDQRAQTRETPPSAKLVFKTLEWHGEMTQRQLVDESLLSPRTVRYAISRLDEIDAVQERIHIPDARQSVYTIAPRVSQSEDAT